MLLREVFESVTPQPFMQWRRWWGNTQTGEMLAVPNGMDHDQYLATHQEQFGISPEAEREEMLEKAHRLGWQAVVYDGSSYTVMFRCSPKNSRHYAIRDIAKTVSEQLPVERVFIDLLKADESTVKDKVELAADRLDRFLQSGRLPRNRLDS